MCIEVSYNHSVKLISFSTKLKYAKIFYTNERFQIKDNNTTASQELKFVYEIRASDRVRQKMGNSAAFSREIMRQEMSIMRQITRFF